MDDLHNILIYYYNYYYHYHYHTHYMWTNYVTDAILGTKAVHLDGGLATKCTVSPRLIELRPSVLPKI